MALPFALSKLTMAAPFLRIGNGAEPKDLDPALITGVPEAFLVRNLFEGLVSKDPATLKIIPGLAESWKVSDHGGKILFTLRKNAKWSNGDPITAEDFVYSWTRLLDPKTAAEYSYHGYYIKNAKKFNIGQLKDAKQLGVKAVNAHTLEVTLEHPSPVFFDILFQPSLYPVPRQTIKEYGTRWTRPGNLVSSGAYRLDQWELHKAIVLKKNNFYWDKKRALLDTVMVFPIERADTEERMFRAHDLDITNTVPLEKIPFWQKDKSGSYIEHPFLTAYYYVLNCKKPPLNNKLVRQALALSIDRERLVKYVLRAGQPPATTVTPPGTGGYIPTPRLPSGDEQFGRARQFLAQAGYPGGKGFPELEILYNTFEGHKKIAEAIQQMWKSNLGISVKLLNQEWKVYLQNYAAMNYQISRTSWTADYNDPTTFLDLWVTEGGNNHTGWSQLKYDQFIEEAGKEMDEKKRFKAFHQAEDLLLEEMPIIPVYFYTRTYLKSPRVLGWESNLQDLHLLKYVQLEP